MFRNFARRAISEAASFPVDQQHRRNHVGSRFFCHIHQRVKNFFQRSTLDQSLEHARLPALEMPNIERLAKEGMKFRNAYASPQCSPSRVCVQTGQSSPRNGYTVYMNSRGQEYYDEGRQYKNFPVIPCVSDQTIDPGTMTIPEALEPLGYLSGHVGKWHMRGDPGDEGYLPRWSVLTTPSRMSSSWRSTT
ncbi:Sulfatase [Allorhodopirellula heiligendammensis]|uniref:Sulfatase n=1 Tax=Allorhodopirellula heiligendammensis TaxID=2714739 RepID=A0A5C6C5G0_9BACT|nr:Sulfatase [Allorhodopirellula heiligendammensis]